MPTVNFWMPESFLVRYEKFAQMCKSKGIKRSKAFMATIELALVEGERSTSTRSTSSGSYSTPSLPSSRTITRRERSFNVLIEKARKLIEERDRVLKDLKAQKRIMEGAWYHPNHSDSKRLNHLKEKDIGLKTRYDMVIEELKNLGAFDFKVEPIKVKVRA